MVYRAGMYVVGYRAYKAVRWEGGCLKGVEGNWRVGGEMKCIKVYGVGWGGDCKK